MQKILIIINDAPYGTEKAYNALRMAMTIEAPRSKLRGNELANSTKSIFDPLL